jgi:phospholipid/cholesterol/gamma-HCH transport system substrate-binding protein
VTTEARVGAFVLACLSILVLTLVYLFNAQFRGGGVPYRTYLHYAGGLEPGGDVLFGGIRAGKITSVGPSREDPTKIEIRLELKDGTPVNEKSLARLGSLSIMSDPALAISTGSNSAPRLSAGATIPSAEAISLDDMTAKLASTADNANALIVQVQGELGTISTGAQNLLANLNSITGPANQRQIQALLQQANALVTNERPKIDHMTDQFLALTQHADAMIGKTGPVIDHADGAIQNVNATVTDLREPMRTDLTALQNTLTQARSLLASMQAIVRANDDNMSDTMENLRTATDNLDQLTETLKQRPWALIRKSQPQERRVPQ